MKEYHAKIEIVFEGKLTEDERKKIQEVEKMLNKNNVTYLGDIEITPIEKEKAYTIPED